MPNTNHLTPLGGYSDAGAKKLRQMAENAAVLTEFLRFQGRVFKHPASVALEFFTQKPDATFIATAAQWEKAGFTVTAGTDAIKFFDASPMPRPLPQASPAQPPQVLTPGREG